MAYIYYLRYLVLLVAWFIIFGWVSLVLVMGQKTLFLTVSLGGDKYLEHFTQIQFVAVTLMQTVLVVLLSRCFFKLAQVLSNCLKEKVIANVVVEKLQSLAKNILVFCLMTLVMQPLIEFALVFNFPEGERAVSVSVSIWLVFMIFLSSTLIPVLKLLRRETIQAF